MKYADGRKIMVGDKVSLGGGWIGTVVCSIDDKEYAAGEPKGAWDYLGTGIIVWTKEAGEIYYDHLDPEMEFLERAAEGK